MSTQPREGFNDQDPYLAPDTQEQITDLFVCARDVFHGEGFSLSRLLSFELLDCQLQVVLTLNDKTIDGDKFTDADSGQGELSTGSSLSINLNQGLSGDIEVVAPKKANGTVFVEYSINSQQRLWMDAEERGAEEYLGMPADEEYLEGIAEENAIEHVLHESGISRVVSKNQLQLLNKAIDSMLASDATNLPAIRELIKGFADVDTSLPDEEKIRLSQPADEKDIAALYERFSAAFDEQGALGLIARSKVFTEEPVFLLNGWQVQAAHIHQQYNVGPTSLNVRSATTHLSGYLTVGDTDNIVWASFSLALGTGGNPDSYQFEIKPEADNEDYAHEVERMRLEILHAEGKLSDVEYETERKELFNRVRSLALTPRSQIEDGVRLSSMPKWDNPLPSEGECQDVKTILNALKTT